MYYHPGNKCGEDQQKLQRGCSEGVKGAAPGPYLGRSAPTPTPPFSTGSFSHARHCPGTRTALEPRRGSPFFLATLVAKSNVLSRFSALLLVPKPIFNPNRGAGLSTQEGRQPGKGRTLVGGEGSVANTAGTWRNVCKGGGVAGGPPLQTHLPPAAEG